MGDKPQPWVTPYSTLNESDFSPSKSSTLLDDSHIFLTRYHFLPFTSMFHNVAQTITPHSIIGFLYHDHCCLGSSTETRLLSCETKHMDVLMGIVSEYDVFTTLVTRYRKNLCYGHLLYTYEEPFFCILYHKFAVSNIGKASGDKSINNLCHLNFQAVR